MKERRSPYGKQQDRELRVIEKVLRMSDEKVSRPQKSAKNLNGQPTTASDRLSKHEEKAQSLLKMTVSGNESDRKSCKK